MNLAPREAKWSLARYCLLGMSMLLVAVLLFAALPKAYAAGGTLTVNTTLDNLDTSDSFCTLREAITESNRTSGAGTIYEECGTPGLLAGDVDVIVFTGFSGTITVSSQLPAITRPVNIQGQTASGYAVGTPTVVVNGNNLLINAFTITNANAAGSTIQGLSITNFGSTTPTTTPGGLALSASAPSVSFINNLVTNNRQGVDATGAGSTVNQNWISGVLAGQSIAVSGDNTTVTGNIVTGNAPTAPANVGIAVTGTCGSGQTCDNILIQGNSVTGHDSDGISVGGQNTNLTVSDNVVSGNTGDGISFTGGNSTGASVTGNIIGRSADNSTPMGNTAHGLLFSAAVGSLTATGNTIANNGNDGYHGDNDPITSVTLNNNCIFGNTRQGVDSRTAAITTDATNNWWGHNSTPTFSTNGNLMVDYYTGTGAGATTVTPFLAAPPSQCASLFVPTAPTTLVATPNGTTAVDLSWGASDDLGTEYRVERSTDGVNFTEIAVVPYPTTTYQDTNVGCSQPLWYRVRAYTNPTSNVFSPYSNVATTTVPCNFVSVASYTNLGPRFLCDRNTVGSAGCYIQITLNNLINGQTVLRDFRIYSDPAHTTLLTGYSQSTTYTGPSSTPFEYPLLFTDFVTNGYAALPGAANNFKFATYNPVYFVFTISNGLACDVAEGGYDYNELGRLRMAWMDSINTVNPVTCNP